jgi:small subunit ribosomal protein S16
MTRMGRSATRLSQSVCSSRDGWLSNDIATVNSGSVPNLAYSCHRGSTGATPDRNLSQEYRVLKLRLRRTGAKKRPSYRIVVAEHSSPRDGRFIEIIGHYDPLTEPATVKVNEDRAKHWLSVGAQPTETVAGLLKRAGVIAAAPAAEAVTADAS